MKRITGLAALILAAGLFFSCTQGEYLGSGGKGNLNIIDLTQSNDLKNKYIEVEGTKTSLLPPTSLTVGFDQASKRKRFTGRKLSAPLYDTDTNDRYNGGSTILPETLTVTVKVYDDATTTTTTTNKGNQTFSVKFYNGSGVLDWK